MQSLLQPIKHNTDPDELSHIVCEVCYPEDISGEISFCGKELTGVDAPEDSLECIVCNDLAWDPCVRCGS